MDLALHFGCIKQGFNGGRRIRLCSSSMERRRNGYVCCKRLEDEGTSNPSRVRREEIVSLFRRIQFSITKERKSRGGEEEKIRDGSYEESVGKAILDVLEKPRNKTEGDTVMKEPEKRQVKVTSPPESKSGKGLEEMPKKEEEASVIETMKLTELKEVAKKKGIKGYSKMKKSDLLELLKSF